MRFRCICLGALVALLAISTADAQSYRKSTRTNKRKSQVRTQSTASRSSKVRRANCDTTVDIGHDLTSLSGADVGCSCGGDGCASCISDGGCCGCDGGCGGGHCGLGMDCGCKLGQKTQCVPYPRCFSFRSPCLDQPCGGPCCGTIFSEMYCDLVGFFGKMKNKGGCGCPTNPFGFSDCGCSGGCSGGCSDGGCFQDVLTSDCGCIGSCTCGMDVPDCGCESTGCGFVPDCGCESTGCGFVPDCGCESVVGCSGGCCDTYVPDCGCESTGGCTGCGGCGHGGGLLSGLASKLFGCGGSCSGGGGCSGAYGGGEYFTGGSESCNSGYGGYAKRGGGGEASKYYVSQKDANKPVYVTSAEMARQKEQARVARESSDYDEEDLDATELATPPRKTNSQARRRSNSNVRTANHESQIRAQQHRRTKTQRRSQTKPQTKTRSGQRPRPGYSSTTKAERIPRANQVRQVRYDDTFDQSETNEVRFAEDE